MSRIKVKSLCGVRITSVCTNFDFITHTLGSNSAATSVVELITFAALSWTAIVFVAILVVLLWYLFHDSKLLVCLL